MSTTSVSVCLTTRGRLALLKESLASVRAQRHAPLEIVVSDNWSEDGTREHVLAVAAEDRRVRYVRPPEPLGLYGNHNFALAHAGGRYVCFFHDDDVYGPEVVSRCAGFLDDHPSVGAVCAAWDRVDLAGRRLRARRRRAAAVTPGREYIERTIASGVSTLALSGTMVRREAIGERPFDEDGPIGFTDMVTWSRVAETYDVGHIEDRLWSYRTHPAAFSNKPAERVAEDHARAFEGYCDEFLARHPDEAERVARWRRAIRRYRFWVLLYAAAARAAAGAPAGESFGAELGRVAASPLERAVLGAVRSAAERGWRAPLALLTRYGTGGRGLIGLG